jgi:hypothetical protein
MIAFIVSTVLALAVAGPGVRAATACQWLIVPSPNLRLNNWLYAIGADVVSDVWAVGSAESDYLVHPLVERWSGGSWTVVPGPTPAEGGWLAGVAAFSPSDVWGVGSQYVNRMQQALIEYWNGRELSVLAGPNIGVSSFLDSISGTTRSDIWAVGGASAQIFPLNRTLAEHWNGNSWAVVPTPNADGNSNQLISVSARSPSDIWAVGYFTDAFGVVRTLAEHWNGSAWAIIPTANPIGSSDDELHGITAVAPDDAWAVGWYTSNAGPQRALVEHWNGRAWRVVPGANGNGQNYLLGVSAASASDVWAVGYYYTIGSSGSQPLAEHWDGSAWSFVARPDDGDQPILDAVDALSASDVWGAGGFVSIGTTLVEHYGCVEPMPSAALYGH